MTPFDLRIDIHRQLKDQPNWFHPSASIRGPVRAGQRPIQEWVWWSLNDTLKRLGP